VILDNLALVFPKASIAHAFASTEAGVAFDVRDGKAGFPASVIEGMNDNIEMRVVNGSLRIRSNRMALRYLGKGRSLVDEDGFVDTGDMVELRGNRYYFVGRREGIINVGGLKVHPEEVEAVINQHPDVQISRVWGRLSPITGAIVVADLVVRKRESFTSLTDEILETCRRVLPRHKVPTTMREVQSIEIMESGKMTRQRA
jgi:acyl-CoA synthetase (AMP-forming)/AMP-acid ligase II